MTEEDLKKIEKGKSEQDKFVFMREEIKSRPINRRKLARNTILAAISAVVFGIVACVTFALIAPFLMERIGQSNTKEETPLPTIITFPEDSEEEEMNPEDMMSVSSVSEEKVEEIDFSAFEILEEEQIKDIINSVKFTVSDYQELYRSLAEISNNAKKSLVRVTPVTMGTDWLDFMYEDSSELSGLILADSGTELFIATRYSAIRGKENIVVTFSNGTQAGAEMINYDTDTDVCILSVLDEAIKDIPEDAIVIPTLGSSSFSSLVGSPVIAVGSPMGTYGSMNYGMITSNTTKITTTDNYYKQVVTNIYGSSSGSGILINLSGEVVGIIDTKYPYADTSNIISAIGISELKRTLERLTNRTDVAMLGIEGSDMPSEAINSGAPDGVFVLSVEYDSPAMNAGIQAGDIITAIGDTPITRFSDFIVAIKSIEIGSTRSVTVARDSQHFYKEVVFDVHFTKANK